MTAKDLLHHVFPWEVTTGVERVESADTDGEHDGGDTAKAA
jgi:hypothetical protein